jgi:hypothetical protein
MSNLRKMPRYETEEAVFCLVFLNLTLFGGILMDSR